ncbi:hypothetical protein CONLIGDRAFT_718677 [Coniochaeta ligniaria NRRL 30616]|uniref:Uncharacterized protein n=1 Tax=Coniochaeta ligniaria NRRL 30616 TaxID=1408157 RepID=A0A1J7I988_9PEZI|nr:hypothetical protein CONLIGDRAFT_718677 [Coniochaeta ligniaria NRRL 30616]
MPDQPPNSRVRYPTLPPLSSHTTAATSDEHGAADTTATADNPQQPHRGRLVDRLQRTRGGAAALTPPRSLRRRSHPHLGAAAAAGPSHGVGAVVQPRRPIQQPREAPVSGTHPSDATSHTATAAAATPARGVTPEILGHWPRCRSADASRQSLSVDPFCDVDVAATDTPAAAPNTPVAPGHWPRTPPQRPSASPPPRPPSPSTPHHQTKPKSRRRRCCCLPIPLPCLSCPSLILLPLLFSTLSLLLLILLIHLSHPPSAPQPPPCVPPEQVKQPTCAPPLIHSLSLPTAASRARYISGLAQTVSVSPSLRQALVGTGLRLPDAEMGMARVQVTMRGLEGVEELVRGMIGTLEGVEGNLTRVVGGLEQERQGVRERGRGLLGLGIRKDGRGIGGAGPGQGWRGLGEMVLRWVADPLGARGREVRAEVERAKQVVKETVQGRREVRERKGELVRRLRGEVEAVCGRVRGKGGLGEVHGQGGVFWDMPAEVRELVAAWWMWCEVMGDVVGEVGDGEGEGPAEVVLGGLVGQLEGLGDREGAG